MRWQIVLSVPGGFIDGGFYQVYVQINNRPNEAYFESFHFTLLYEAAKGGAITEGNAWIFSFCDPIVFSDIAGGNYQ